MTAPRSKVAARFSASNHCDVCATGSKGCSVTEDGLFLCRGEPSNPSQWKETSKTADDKGFRYYRRADDTRHLQNGHASNGKVKKPRTPHPKLNAKPEGPQTWREQAIEFAKGADKNAIAANLRLPIEAFNPKTPVIGLGYTEFGTKDGLGAWVGAVTFMMVDGQLEPCGIQKRLDLSIADTNKYTMPGGEPGKTLGLFLGRDWDTRPGPLLIPEGGSDTAALAACGLAAIGRPSNVTGAELLAEALADYPTDRRIVIGGENDKKHTGKWPGKEGTDSVAPKLATLLNRSVFVVFPPEGIKDWRDWVRELLADQAELDLSAIGDKVRQYLESVAVEVKPGSSPPAAGTQSSEVGELLIESLELLRPKPISWLVPNRIPAGMLGLLAGEGGHGKSVTTLELAAGITAGRCVFGLTYPNPISGKALLVSCEDDWERTIIPRLAVFGADLSRVLRIRGVKLKADGQTLDFHLGHFAELEKLLKSNPEIRLVVIDPAGAYIGRAGVNESKDADLRAILGPLSEASNKTGAAIFLVKHLNKSANVSAVQRVSGSTGYVNAVRFAYIVAPDIEDPKRKHFHPLKTNILPAGQDGLAYRLDSIPPDEAREILLRRWSDLPAADLDALAVQLLRQTWESGVNLDVNDLANGHSKRAAKSDDVSKCIEFIIAFLGQWSWPDAELTAAFEKTGFSFKAFKTAKATLRDADRTDPKRLSSKPRGEGGPWWCWIGPQSYPKPDRTGDTAPLPSCVPD